MIDHSQSVAAEAFGKFLARRESGKAVEARDDAARMVHAETAQTGPQHAEKRLRFDVRTGTGNTSYQRLRQRAAEMEQLAIRRTAELMDFQSNNRDCLAALRRAEIKVASIIHLNGELVFRAQKAELEVERLKGEAELLDTQLVCFEIVATQRDEAMKANEALKREVETLRQSHNALALRIVQAPSLRRWLSQLVGWVR